MTVIDYSIYYSRFHPDLREHDEQTIESMKHMLAPLVPEDRHSRVLDIGCGFGFALLALQRLGFKDVQGIEVSPQQATRARSHGLEVELVESSTDWLNQRERTFSLIILRDVLEHVPVTEQIPLLRAIRNSLKPNGRVIVQVPNANAILASRWRYNDFTHYSSFTEHSLFFVLKNAGFDKIDLGTNKGLARPSFRLWRKDARTFFLSGLRRYFVRWCWLQVFKAELPFEDMDAISFDLNLTAIAYHDG